MTTISNDLIERTNKLFERIKHDPEFQYNDDDLEIKEIILNIDKDASNDDENQIQLQFTVAKIKIIKNINITRNLIAFPCFQDFLPPKVMEHKIKCIVNGKEVPRESINMMLFEKECINDDKNIQFVFPKNCISNIPNKLYINEFSREIIHLTIHYIHSKILDILINNSLHTEIKPEIKPEINTEIKLVKSSESNEVVEKKKPGRKKKIIQ